MIYIMNGFMEKELKSNMANEKETAEILKEALKIVDKLAKCEFNGSMDEFIDVQDDIEELIKRAKKLTKNTLWKLK